MLASFGDWPLQVVRVWTMCRERKHSPMGDDLGWGYDSQLLRDLYEAEHEVTIGLDYADALEGVLIATREANTDPEKWPEVYG